MAFAKLMKTKDGKRFYKISVSRGRGITPYTERLYWEDGWSPKTMEKKLGDRKAELNLLNKKGELETPKEKKQREAEEAEKAAAEAAKVMTVRQYADDVFMPLKEITISENSRCNYRMCLDCHILPVIGDLPLVDVTPAILNKLVLNLQRAGYKFNTVSRIYTFLSVFFKAAFMDDSIPISPMLKVAAPVRRKDEAMHDNKKLALTAPELRAVLSCADKEPLKWRTFIYFLADSGARKGEALGLQWSDIDFENGKAKIQRNLQYTPEAGVYVTTPKTGKTRSVDLGAKTLSLLRQLRIEQADTCISQWIFTSEGSPEPLNPYTPTKYFAKFGAKYGFENFHPHLLRHTSASIALTNNVDPVSIAERLGHSDPTQLFRRYGHANEESMRRAGQAVRDVVMAAND